MPPFITDSKIKDYDFAPPVYSPNDSDYDSKQSVFKYQYPWEKRYNSKFNSSGFDSFSVPQIAREKWIVNLTGKLIPDDVLDVACLGAKFGVPIIQKSHIPINKIIATIESKIDLFDENERKNIRETCTSVISKFIMKNRRLTSRELELIKKIETTKKFQKINPDIIFLKADKGNVTVIVNHEFYISQMSKLLNDTETYRIIEDDPTPTIQRKVNKLIVKWYKRNLITDDEKSKLSSKNAVIARSYGLPKIHKKNIPFRMIVSFIGTPTYKLAKYIQKILSNTVREEIQYFPSNKATITNSLSLVKKIKNLNLPNNFEMISMDVVSLFTNVPLDLVIFGVKKRWNTVKKFTQIKQSEFIEAVELCFNASAFQFNKIIYQQVFGAAMGSPLSPIVAEIVLLDLEDFCFGKLDFPVYFYTRYVDDILVFLPKNKINSMLNCFNSYHQRMKFTVENEINNKINFLEITLIKNKNNISIDWYKKPTSSGRYLNYNSHHPRAQKKSTICNLTDHAILLSDREFHLKNLCWIKQILYLNGYPKTFVKKVINQREEYLFYSKKFLNQYQKDKRSDNSKYLILPYVYGLSEKLKFHLKKFETHLSFKNDSNLRWLYTGSTDKLSKKLKINTIYKISCLDCNFVFIDHTKCQLGITIDKHYQSLRQPHIYQITNELTQHAFNHKHYFNFNKICILGVESNYKKRELLASIFREKFIHSDDESIVKISNISKIYSSLFHK